MPPIEHSVYTPHAAPVFALVVHTEVVSRIVQVNPMPEHMPMLQSEPATEPVARHVPAVPNTLSPTQSWPVGHTLSNVLHAPPMGAAVKHVPGCIGSGFTQVRPAEHMSPAPHSAPTTEPFARHVPECKPR